MDLNQVTIQVNNFHESIEFYKTIGFKLIVSSGEHYARFELPSGSSTFSIHTSNAEIMSTTILYFETDNVDHKFSELVARGITFKTKPIDQDWGWREARFNDPSGNQLCLFHVGQNRRFPAWRIEPDQ